MGYLHAINPCIWPHLRLYFWLLIRFNYNYKIREEKREVYVQRQLGSHLGCVHRSYRLARDKQYPTPFGRFLKHINIIFSPQLKEATMRFRLRRMLGMYHHSNPAATSIR